MVWGDLGCFDEICGVSMDPPGIYKLDISHVFLAWQN